MSQSLIIGQTEAEGVQPSDFGAINKLHTCIVIVTSTLLFKETSTSHNGHAQSQSKVGIAEVDIDVVKLSRLNRYRYISYPGDLPLQVTLTLTPIGGEGR